MSEPRMLARKEGAAGWLTFSNPDRLNAVSLGMWSAIPDLLGPMVEDPDVRVIILRGDGDKAFVSGADISEFETKRGTREAREVYEAAGKRANAAIQGCPKPTIAMIRGYCIGGGVGVALGCDLRLAASDARFAIPAAKLGLGYDYEGVQRLVGIVAPAFAKEIFFTARQFDAAEAAGMGLLNRVVEPAALGPLVHDYIERIAANAPLTIAASKLAVNVAASDPPGKDVSAVKRAVEACFESEDYREGRRAFGEKRKPVFQGR